MSRAAEVLSKLNEKTYSDAEQRRLDQQGGRSLDRIASQPAIKSGWAPTIIPKGTKVRVRTTNGGEATGTLAADHHTSIAATLGRNDVHLEGGMHIPNHRLKSIDRIR